MKKTFTLTSLIVTLLTVSIQAQTFNEAPLITERINPNISNTKVFSFHDAIKDASLGVVNISTKKLSRMQRSPFMDDPFFRDFFGGRSMPQERLERSLGSGVIINKDGYIITNSHVVKGADEIVVTLPNSKKEYKATLIGEDRRSDLAVIKIKAKNLHPLTLADSHQLKVGDIVFAIGNPFGIGETVTQGIVSALGRSGVGINEYENFIQTDASINPGNSGGALIDSRGFLIGINTAIISRGGGNNGVGFAIPTAMVKHVVSSLIKSGKVQRGLLGVHIDPVSEDLYDFY
ncbi:MAG: trypsin-like peptidase domain-containing protein [Thiovulaceae bacterium]|nr:trypsin-like peptidase domain-containing protein [Sulfurimonadaceae bacterium]